jgi:hypothetical protein
LQYTRFLVFENFLALFSYQINLKFHYGCV